MMHRAKQAAFFMALLVMVIVGNVAANLIKEYLGW